MLLFSLIVAGSFSFGKLIAGQIDPAALTAARFALAAGLLGLVLGLTGRLRAAHYRSPWRFLFLGGTYAVFFVLMFEALKTASPVSTAAVFTLMPFFAALLQRGLLGWRSSALVWLALAIGAAGALWVVFGGSLARMLAFRLGRGEALFMIGTLSHAAYAALVPGLRRGEPAYATTLGVALGGALILSVLYLPTILATNWAGLGLLVWATLAYLAVFAGIGTFSLVNIAAMRLPAAKVTAYTYLIPFWVVLIEALSGRGLPHPALLLGGVPIALALFILFLERPGGCDDEEVEARA